MTNGGKCQKWKYDNKFNYLLLNRDRWVNGH